MSMILAVIFAGLFVCVSSGPVTKFTHVQQDMSYQDEPEFQMLLQKNLKRLKETGNDDIHGTIVAVNDVHRKYLREAIKKRNKSTDIDASITVVENIVETNQEDGLDLFEGDIILSKEQQYMVRLTGTQDDAWKRSAGRQNRYGLWHSRRIAYSISPSLRHARSKIKEAIRTYERDTCLRFYEISGRPSNFNYLYFDRKAGCYSLIGRSSWKKRQDISLGMGCDSPGTILHELTHAMGFYHEQSRTDRDKYVKIMWENIQEGKHNEFESYGHGEIDVMKIPYDYESIMHYSRITFTANGDPTVVRLDNPKGKLGRSGGSFSQTDKIAINALYDCTNKPVGHRGFSTWTNWTPCNYACKRIRQRFCINAPNKYQREKLCPGAGEHGVQMETKKCTPSQCGPIDAGWGAWGSWSRCSVNCGLGTRTRTRKCDNPMPMRDGKACPESNKGTGKCSMGRCSLGRYDTQFEGNTGLWTIKGNGYFKWRVRGFYSVPGPKGDHTTGKGKYLEVGTGNNAVFKGKTTLSSPGFGFSGLQCLLFYYCMDGASVGTLAVKLTVNNVNSRYLFKARGGKDRNWHLGTAFINVPRTNYKLTFEATGTGSKERGTIALDDVYIEAGRCPSPPTAVKPTTPPCIDINKKCLGWARTGECKKNPKYMNRFCRKSCVCQPVKCEDKNKKCSIWAGTGECKKNHGWMKNNCCKSCVTAANCKDKNKKCSVWAGDGECKKNAGWMKKNCCKSCTKAARCLDKNKKCSVWAGDGECKKNTGWMKKNCCHSCNAAQA